MPGTPHTCTVAQLQAGDTSQCYACQETHGHSTGAPVVDLEAAALLEAMTAATGGTVHRLTIDGPACGIGTDTGAAWLALDSNPAAVTCPECAGWHDPECTGCAHACPWTRTPAPLGAPFCGTCDDHAEAIAAGYEPEPVPDVEQLRAGSITGPAAVLFGDLVDPAPAETYGTTPGAAWPPQASRYR